MATDNDVILEALEKVKDWAMERMLQSPSDKGEHGEMHEQMPSEEEEPAAELDVEVIAEPLDVDDEEEKPSVFRRYDFAGAKPPKPSSRIPVKRR